MFFVNWQLALVALAITPLIVVLAYRYSHVSHPVLRDVQQKLADVATVAEENIVGVHVVKSFAQERAEQAKFARPLRGRLPARASRANRQRALYVPLLSFLPLLAQAAVLLVGGRMVVERLALARRVLRRSTSTLAMLVMPLRMLGMWIGQAQRATASGERIFEVLDEPEEIADAAGRARAAARARARPLRERHVRLRRRAGRCSTDIDLELEPGRTVALIGHTGSGKTTLASLVPRFYDVTAGRVHDRRRRRARRRRSPRCGARSASSRRIRSSSRRPCARTSRSARPDATDEEVERAARLAQAHEFIERAARRLRHGDRRARDHALGRPAPADRDRARAASSTRGS